MQLFSARSHEGIHSCRVPIKYTWVERDKCGYKYAGYGAYYIDLEVRMILIIHF